VSVSEYVSSVSVPEPFEVDSVAFPRESEDCVDIIYN